MNEPGKEPQAVNGEADSQRMPPVTGRLPGYLRLCLRFAEAGGALLLLSTIAAISFHHKIYPIGFFDGFGSLAERMLLDSFAIVLATLVLYVPGWLRRRRLGHKPQFNARALVYLLSVLYLALAPLVQLSLNLPFKWSILGFPSMPYAYLMWIFLGVAVGETLWFRPPSGADGSAGARSAGRALSFAYLAGILLFLSFFWVNYRYRRLVSGSAGTFPEEMALDMLWSLLLLAAAAVLGLPRFLAARRGEEEVIFDSTRFAFFVIPGIFILVSYHLYFILPWDPLQQLLGILFACFDLHLWGVAGAVITGLGLWMSVVPASFRTGIIRKM
ncbi:MAG: hypothetical protein AB1556_16025 [Bacillota bacterium]